MARSVTTVVGPVIFGDGSPITNGRLNFELTTYDKETGEAFYVSGPFSVDVSQTGDFTIDLFDNSKGENDSSYKVYATYISSSGKTKTEEFGHLFLTGSGPYKFADLSFAPDWIPTNQDLMSQLQGYATAANQAGVFATQAQEALAETIPLAEQVETDAQQVTQDRVATGQDRVATGEDRYQTGVDRLAVEAVGLYVNSMVFFVSEDDTSVTVVLAQQATFTDPGPGLYPSVTIEVP